ncbi:hypothetical protein QEH56_05300 [Pelagicoccus enzymogenes]|uniref:methyltransferase domain-containing protein n=1 Tax=Pelagicoccus enzymogenes TaxID=2773457 RepID=UPI00280D5791|nr:methyltransferase domain-containing protein [Pelagicoccus enzymogenes]MDQ8197553.1 hypothetical protein [Pelagicoccus enzymogenes]
MDRVDLLLRDLKLKGRGLEIGPSHNPVVSKASGLDVRILDNLDRDGLIERYREHHVKLDSIESVDYVWNGERYVDLIGDEKCFDWIVASHVVEHTVDLIGFLKDCNSILKDDGVLSLAVPDKRYCFDRFRPISGLANVIDNHLYPRRNHSAGVAAEYFMNVVSRAGKIAWGRDDRGEFEFIHTVDDALMHMELQKQEKGGVDLHAWCFVPSSFRLLIHDLKALGLMQLDELSFKNTNGGEFFVSLSRAGKGADLSREELLLSVDEEISFAM